MYFNSTFVYVVILTLYGALANGQNSHMNYSQNSSNDNLIEIPNNATTANTYTQSNDSIVYLQYADEPIKMIVKPGAKLTIAGKFFDTENTIIEGELYIKNNAEIEGKAPVYSNTSKLIYYDAQNYERGKEWDANGVGTTFSTPGYPYDVIIKENSSVNIAGDTPNIEKAIENILEIYAGCSLNMATNAMSQPLTVGGNITSAGNITLSTANGGNLHTHGNIDFTTGYTFTGNIGILKFNKNGTQLLNAPANQTLTISYLAQDPADGSNLLLLYTNLNVDANNEGIAMNTGVIDNIIDINGYELSIGSPNKFNTIAGLGSLKGGDANTTSKLFLKGKSSVGTLFFTPNYNYLQTLSIDRDDNIIGAVLGNDLITKNLILAKGHLDTDVNSMIITEDGEITTPSQYSFVIADKTKNGFLRKNFPQNLSNTETFLFPIGKNQSQYTPLTINLKNTEFSTDAYVAVTVQNNKYLKNPATNNYLNRFWEIVAKNIENPTYDLSATYLQSDVNGDENLLISGQFETSTDIWREGLAVQPIANSISFSNLATNLTPVNGHSTIYTAGDSFPKHAFLVLGNENPIANGSTTTSTLNHTQFENTPIGSTSSRIFKIVNTGSEMLTISNIEANTNSHFNVINFTNSVTLAAGESLNFEVQFEPTSTVPEIDNIVITNSSPSNPTFTFNIGSYGILHTECGYEPYESTISTQNFEDINNNNDLTYVVSPNQIITAGTGHAILGDEGNTAKYITGKSLQITNNTSNVTFYGINTTNLKDASFSIKLAAFGANKNSGVNSNDAISVAISTDGGNTFSDELSINGYKQAKWSFDNANAKAEIDYDGNGNIESNKTFLMNEGGYRTNDGYGEIIIRNLPKSDNLHIKLTTTANAQTTWAFEDAILKGKKQKIKTWNGTWTDQNGIAGVVPSIQDKVIFTSHYNSAINGGTVNACSCDINNEVIVTIHPDHNLNVHNELKVLGELDIKSSGSLVQHNDYAINEGEIKMQRTTPKIHRFDYVYWSSPLKTSANYLLGKNPQDLNQLGLSPNTTYNKFHSYTADQEWDIILYGNAIMQPGKGYIIRAPHEALYGVNPYNPTAYNTFTANFKGEPNNGVILSPLMQPEKFTLLGNPFASAIDPEIFLLQNGEKGIIDGTIYIWTHQNFSLNSQNNLFEYSAADYATFNLSGYTNTNPNIEHQTLNDDYKIPAAQSFFIKGASVTGNAIFNNSMRVLGNNSHFFRPTQPHEPNVNWHITGKHRYWLNISNTDNNFNQMMVGYIQNATNNLDWGYDGKVQSESTTLLYSLLDENRLSIQGRQLPFMIDDTVPLGYQANNSGTYSISMPKFDGFFVNQNIYLHDLSLNTIHNLKFGPYSFYSNQGVHNDRFLIRYYIEDELSTPDIIDNNLIYCHMQENNLIVTSTKDNIQDIIIYDLSGRLILSKTDIYNKICSFDNVVPFPQALILNVKLSTGQTHQIKTIYK